MQLTQCNQCNTVRTWEGER